MARVGRSRLGQVPGAGSEGAGPLEHHGAGGTEAAGTRAALAVRPRALRVLVPRAVAEAPEGPFGAQAGL